MPSNLTEVTGGGAIFPTNIVGPVDVDPAIDESVREGMRALANRTQYLSQLGAKQVVAILTAAGIPVDAGNVDALTEAVQAMIDTIATVNASRVLVSNALVVDATGTALDNALAVIAAAGGQAGILATSSGNEAGVTGTTDGSYTNKHAPCGLYGVGQGQATGVYGVSVSTGIGGVFEGGPSAGDALHAYTRGGAASGANAIIAMCSAAAGVALHAQNTAAGASTAVRVSGNGTDMDMIQLNGRVRFSGGTINPSTASKNALYGLNTVKAFATITYNGSAYSIVEGYGITSAAIEETNSAVCTITMDIAMQTTTYLAKADAVGGTGPGYRSYITLSDATAFPRTTTKFSVSKCDSDGNGVARASGDEFTVIVMGKQS